MKIGTPVLLKADLYEGVEKQINAILLDMIYKDIVKLMSRNFELRNADDPLIEAIRSGNIIYQDGKFTGSFNARTSKQLSDLGAKFNRITQSWDINKNNIPPSIGSAVVAAKQYSNKLTASVIQSLDSINPELYLESPQAKLSFKEAINKIDSDLNKSIKTLSVAVSLSEEQKEVIRDAWEENLKLYIKDWTEDNINKLRQEVKINSFAGARAENLEKIIQRNYGASRNKAKFLARQETSLLMSKMRETRYQEAGLTKYKWSTSKDGNRVREDHRLLDGEIFSWDSPPIVNRSKGTRAHPGEDFGCRCVAIPVLD